MEGGKPGWNDAMNGLPGILGSGMPETYEALRILQFVSFSSFLFRDPLSTPSHFFSLPTPHLTRNDAHRSRRPWPSSGAP